MHLDLVRIIDLPVDCWHTIIPLSVYDCSWQFAAVVDIQTEAVYYSDPIPEGYAKATQKITYKGKSYIVSVHDGEFRLEHSGRAIALIRIPGFEHYYANSLFFHILSENPLRIHILFRTNVVELEIITN